MAIPTTVKLTPYATITEGAGAATDASSEFWQLVGADRFIVYEGVPYSLMQQLLQHDARIDGQIALQLAGYPKRVSS